MKILHVASFLGNIGDNASHAGTRYILSQVFDIPIEYTQLEIRKSYTNYSRSDRWAFDDAFVSTANSHDLVVIGGGGFLDFSIPNSVTGTTIDIDAAVLGRIDTPIAIMGVGCTPRRSIPDGNVEKFKDFLDVLLGRDDILVTVRNDGSTAALDAYLGSAYARAVPAVYDSAFFYVNESPYATDPGVPYILINTTVDQIEAANRGGDPLEPGDYHAELATVVRHILASYPHRVMFAPHIASDVGAISEVCRNLDDHDLRSRVEVAPYMQGDRGCHTIFSAYNSSDLVLGMRFHANVCGIALGKRVIGLAALARVAEMYEQLGFPDSYVEVTKDFARRLIERSDASLSRKNVSPTVAPDLLRQKRRDTLDAYMAGLRRIVTA